MRRKKDGSPTLKNCTGIRYGRLTAIESAGTTKDGKSLWRCLCDCGKESIVRGQYLRSGHTRSCGCLEIENRIKHGKHGSRTYHAWEGMLGRCLNMNNLRYGAYGGRGIKVCNKWKNFMGFYEDMGNVPKSLSLDRINNDGDYELANCRWATRKQQQGNRRNSVLITYNGNTKCLTAWAEELGMSVHAFRGRIKLGWSVQRIMSTPVPKRRTKQEA